MSYRETQHADERLTEIQTLVDRALEADNTQDMTTYAGYAQAAAVDLKEHLQDSLDAETYAHADRGAVIDAIDALSEAAVMGEKVGLGIDVPTMRTRVIDFKTALDEATEKVREALGKPAT